MIDSIFFMDILIVFRTTFINEKGDEITDNFEIAKNYLKSTFIIDFLATIPFDDLISLSNSSDTVGTTGH